MEDGVIANPQPLEELSMMRLVVAS